MENKTFEERIYDTQELIKDVIGASDLNIAVIELIIRNIYLEIKHLAEKNLQEKIRQSAEQKEKSEETKDGDSTGI